MSLKVHDYNDPFSTYRKTRLIQLNRTFPAVETAALLSRYSRSTKSLVDLYETEFRDENRAPTFIKKLLSEYGDESIAEMANEALGVEGISILGASKLTDSRIGISFIEKSTRYVPFSVDSFYIPAKIYEIGLVDEYKDLCGLSHSTFTHLFRELSVIFKEKHPISTCRFDDSELKTDTLYENLRAEGDIKAAKSAYERAIKDKVFDIAGYSWLLSLKTSIGLNANYRSLKNLIENTAQSSLAELNDLSFNLLGLLSPSPFFGRLKKKGKNPFDIYKSSTTPSITSIYKSNIINVLNPEERFRNTINETPVKMNTALIKNLLSEIGMSTTTGSKMKFKGSNVNTLAFEPSMFEPNASLTSVYDEKNIIDTLCSAILFENNENLLEYDDKNSNNLDDSLRITGIDMSKVKSGILFDMLNINKSMSDMLEDEQENNFVNKITENKISFSDMMDYWYYNFVESDNTLYQDYERDGILSLDKDQEFLLRKYIGDRESRRDKIGRAAEFVEYSFELSSSFRIMREFKRHRTLSAIYPQVITARNSYDSFIFPFEIVQNKDLFDIYRNLIDKSFGLYQKIVKKADYVTAQYVLPLSTRCNYLAKINLRELDYLLSLRTTPQAHQEFRMLCQNMYELVKIVHPNVSKLLTFVDMNQYQLGRIKAEYKKEMNLGSVKSSSDAHY